MLPDKAYSETKATQIDEEISRVMEEAHERVRKILSERRKSWMIWPTSLPRKRSWKERN